MGLLITVLSAFIIGSLISLIAAGPVSFLIFHHALLGQYRKSFAMIFGAALMESVYAGIAVFSLGLLIGQSEKIILTAQGIATLICLFLGIHFLTQKYNPLALRRKPLIKEVPFRSFLFALLLVALNPTIILTWSAAITILLSFDVITLSTRTHALFFMAAVFLGILLGSSLMVSGARYYKKSVTGKVILKTIRIMGALLILLGLYFAVQFFQTLR